MASKNFCHPRRPGDVSPTPRVQDLAVAVPSQNVMLYYLPHKKQFIMRANHMLTDGHGLTMIFQTFFAEMDRLAAGKHAPHPEKLGAEVQLLSPGTFHAAGVDRLGEECLQSFQASLTNPQPTMEACEIPATYDAIESDPRGRSQALDYSTEETKRLINTSKLLGVGLTPLIHASLVHAAHLLGGKTDSAIHSTVLIFNARDECRRWSPNTTSAQAAALRIGFWPVQITIAEDIFQTAANFKGQYDLLARNKLPILASMVPHLEKSLPILAKNYFRSIIPSFIGNLSRKFPQRYRFFKVQKFWLVALPTDTRTYVGIQTFGNRLSIRLAYDERYHSDEQMAEYLRLIKHQLCLLSLT